MFMWMKDWFKKETKEIDPLVVEALSYSKAKLDKDISRFKMDKATQNKELLEWAILYMNEHR